MICIQCNEAQFVSGTAMCRNDGRIFCQKLNKLVDKYQECELESLNKKDSSLECNLQEKQYE